MSEQPMSSIEHRAKFNFIRYANLWEDADILCRALKPEEGKRLLSIASGGDNAFALLAEGAEVVAADLNPAQLACVELKRSAFKKLEYEELLGFIGIRPSLDRNTLYKTLRLNLSAEARGFWDTKQEEIAHGIIHAGKFERYFQLFRNRILPFIHGQKTVTALFLEKSAKERESFYENTWNTIRWRLLFRFFFSRFMMGRLGRDPEFFRYVQGRVSDRFLERTRYAFTVLSPHHNPYLQYILLGCYDTALPRCYRLENFNAIKSHLHRLTLHLGPIQEAAELRAGEGFDGFNLSDIFEYLDEETSSQIYSRLLKEARPGARFAYWNMLVPRRCPARHVSMVTSLDELAAELFRDDLAFFYTNFILEELSS
jgi:S-adenosylmethionine-diacylglycerol 3-amino-3-carboxypropyl transferase